ncbi:MAG: tRNA pseudouridine(38-40) synthase TruA [Verrucomicrobiota bacterium]|nr:tRNA pseudouridine(38-40) synthase TruA [Verrucomicrobiota bacterium]
MERPRRARAIDGTDPDLDRRPNVLERPQHLHPAPTLTSYSLLISYDGTGYFGWQKTAAGPSIQGELEKALHHLFQEAITPEASSRTDRGVHARGQVVQFVTSKTLPPDRLRHAFNALLPRDIRVREAHLVPASFHPTLDADSKTYTYDLCLGPVQEPFFRRFSWHYPYPLNFDLMKKAAADLLGTHDFSAFTTEPPADPLRTLLAIEIILLPNDRLRLSITGDRFLYKMARTIAGTLANIGSGKLPSDLIPRLFVSPDRTLAGMTAPAHGLTLDTISFTPTR